MPKSSKERYVAVKAHVLSECGRGLLELLERVKTLGSCTLGEGLADALSIADMAGDRELILVGCVEPAAGDWVEVSTVSPPEGAAGALELVESGGLWLGLAGDVSVDGSIDALRVFLGRPFTAVRVSAATSSAAYRLALEALERLCAGGEG
ncbi:MAG: hypothetical protein QXJ21_01545 [Thermofilum sp.]